MNTLITNMSSTDFIGILPDDLSQPKGQPVAVLMSLTDYEHYQTFLAQQKILSEKQISLSVNLSSPPWTNKQPLSVNR